MPDLIYIGKDVQSFQKSTRFQPYDRVILNLDDNNYISSPSVSVTNASVYNSYSNGTYNFTFTAAQNKWKTPTDTYVTTSQLAQNYGLTTHYSDVTSPKSGDVITVTKTTVNNEPMVTAELSRSGSTLTADCPLVKPSDRQAVADNLLKRVYGFEYQPFSAKGAYMNPAAEIGDAITAYNVFSGLFEQETIFNRLMLSNIGSAISDEAEVEMQYEMNTDRRYNRKLAETSAEFSILADRISSLVTNQDFQAALTTMANQIEAKVSESGGNQNTFGWSLDSNGFYLYANGAQVFKCDRSGITVVGDATITGEVYASNIRSDAVNGYGGSFSGYGITPATVATAACESGIVQSLGYADVFNSATYSNSPLQYFKAAQMVATSSFYSPSFICADTSGQAATEVNLTGHYHSFTESGGKIILGVPHNDSSIDRHSFNIADTQAYRDGVAAVTVASRAVLYCNSSYWQDFDTGFDCDMTGSSYHYEVNGVQYGRLAIRNSSGTTLKTVRVKLPGGGSGAPTVSQSGANGSLTHQGIVSATATANGQTATNDYDIYLSVTQNDASAVSMEVYHGSGANKVVLATRSVTPQGGSSTVSRFELNGNPGWRCYPTIGTANNYYIDVGVKALDSGGSSMGTGVLNFEVTSLLVEAAQWGAANWGSCSGHVEITSTSGNSAFVKIYDSSWNAVPVGSSSVGKWITAGTSETFG